MLVPNERTHQVCTSILYIYLFASYFHNLLSVSLILYIFSELALQTTSTFLLVILARRSLMLPYLHASLRILLARESNIAGQFFFFLIDGFFDLNVSFENAETQGSCGIRRLAVQGVLVLFLFAISRSANVFVAYPYFFLFINEN